MSTLTTYEIAKNIVSHTITKLFLIKCLYQEDDNRLVIDICEIICRRLYDCAIVRHKIDDTRKFMIGDVIRIKYYDSRECIDPCRIIYRIYNYEVASYAIQKRNPMTIMKCKSRRSSQYNPQIDVKCGVECYRCYKFSLAKCSDHYSSYRYPSIIETIQWMKIYESLPLPYIIR